MKFPSVCTHTIATPADFLKAPIQDFDKMINARKKLDTG